MGQGVKNVLVLNDIQFYAQITIVMEADLLGSKYCIFVQN